MSNIGRMRHRMQIQRYSEVQDNSHGTTKTWTTISTVFAEMVAVKGYTTFDTQQINEAVTHKITIRYQPYITSELWLLMNSRRFRIRNVRNLSERNRFLELLCEEVFHAFDNFTVDVDAVEQPLRQDVPEED